MLKAVLFDCDGVIVDSEPPTLVLLAEEFSAHGLDVSQEQIAHQYVGGTMADLATRARAAGARLPENWVATFYERLYAQLALGTPLVPGFTVVLDALDRAGIPYAIGSNGTEEKMRITLGQHAGLQQRFRGHIYSGQKLGKPKPLPDLYLHAAAALGATPDECVVVEDSATGARAARRAGMRCFGYATQTPAALLEAEGAVPFTRMEELPALLGI